MAITPVHNNIQYKGVRPYQCGQKAKTHRNVYVSKRNVVSTKLNLYFCLPYKGYKELRTSFIVYIIIFLGEKTGLEMRALKILRSESKGFEQRPFVGKLIVFVPLWQVSNFGHMHSCEGLQHCAELYRCSQAEALAVFLPLQVSLTSLLPNLYGG